jgi:hypothetical protein
MVTRMMIDVEIADALLAETTRAAAEDDTTIEALVEDGLRRVLDARRQRKPLNSATPVSEGGGG